MISLTNTRKNDNFWMHITEIIYFPNSIFNLCPLNAISAHTYKCIYMYSNY